MAPQPTARELLEQLNTLDEQERVEAKRAAEVGRSLLETVCALANEPGLDGGCMLLGVGREEMALFPAYEVEGIEQPDKVTADLASQCRGGTFNRPVQVDITTEELSGKPVLLVRVHEAAPQDKPIYFVSRACRVAPFGASAAPTSIAPTTTCCCSTRAASARASTRAGRRRVDGRPVGRRAERLPPIPRRSQARRRRTALERRRPLALARLASAATREQLGTHRGRRGALRHAAWPCAACSR